MVKYYSYWYRNENNIIDYDITVPKDHWFSIFLSIILLQIEFPRSVIKIYYYCIL